MKSTYFQNVYLSVDQNSLTYKQDSKLLKLYCVPSFKVYGFHLSPEPLLCSQF
jgi:hypothetical protein